MKKSKKEEPEVKVLATDNYNTVIIGGSGTAADEVPRKKNATLISLLADTNDRNLKEEVLTSLKNSGKNAKELLLAVIADPKYASQRQILVAACWEAGLDFSDKLDFFVNLAIEEKDYGVLVEVLSVIDTMETKIEQPILDSNIERAEKSLEFADPSKQELIKDLITRLKQY